MRQNTDQKKTLLDTFYAVCMFNLVLNNFGATQIVFDTAIQMWNASKTERSNQSTKLTAQVTTDSFRV